VLEGHRSVADQAAIVARYEAEVRAAHPGLPTSAVRRLTSRFVSPVQVAPHVAGAAVDLTLVALRDRLQIVVFAHEHGLVG
jgi:zinc D-Ala-D-Ala dipeptidase